MAVRVAANPIPYWLTGTVSDKSKENLDVAFRDLSAIGFSSVKADVPEGMTVPEYLEWVREYTLAPAVSLYNSTFDRSTPVSEDVENAKRFAAQQHELGLTVTMLCPIFVPERLRQPAVGAEFDEGRFQNILEDVAAVADAIRSEGVYPVLHGHVGGWVETETEIRRVLDTLGKDRLGFGPDTGHQTWAGADVAALIRDYSDRVRAIHIKDVFPDHIRENRNPAHSYTDITLTGRHWAEPGKGVVDFDAVLAAMPADYSGDYMIEVDVPSAGTSRYDSLKQSYDWAVSKLSFASI